MDVLHVDANSAYLSWSATWLLEKGYGTDIREIPAVIAGDPDNRHGIILAKSQLAKKFGISTGESLMEAREKCPDLFVYPPDYDLYLSCSNSMYKILKSYTDKVERYSIDECFLDISHLVDTGYNPVKLAYEIQAKIFNNLGFTVNVGVSTNKLLAKMAGEIEKPNKVITLYKEEIPKKLWPLPVEELFMVGRASKKKLNAMGIFTVGQLAKTEPMHLKAVLKSHGILVWEYANGIDNSRVCDIDEVAPKSIGNSITIWYDVTKYEEAKMILYSLCERTCQRLRHQEMRANLVGIRVKYASFLSYTHQEKLRSSLCTTYDIYTVACRLLKNSWDGNPIRQLGIWVGELSDNEAVQLSLFNQESLDKNEKIDKTIDKVREKFGEQAVIKGCFANSDFDPMLGGTNDGNYIMMGGHASENSSKTYRYNCSVQQRK